MDALLTNLFPVLGIPADLFTTFVVILGFRKFLRNPRYRGFCQQDQDDPSVRPVSVFAFRALFFRYGLLSGIVMVGWIPAWSLTTGTRPVSDRKGGELAEWEVVPPLPPPVEDRIWTVVEDMPRFPRCEELGTTSEQEACAQRKLLEFLQDHARYPELAKEVRLDGTVVASFLVEKDGPVSHIRIIREIGAACGEEVLRFLRLMQDGAPHWSPGRQQGNPVRVEIHLPVRFRLP